MTQRVLVFDSGVGGLSIVDSIMESGSAFVLDYLADNAWLPYGLKSDSALQARVPELLCAAAAQWAPDAIVIACNTASTIALDAVRARLDIPVVGVVPPIKPAAAMSKSGVIGLLATPATIARPYTDNLVAQFASGVHVVRAGSAALVAAAEEKLSGGKAPHQAFAEAIQALFGAPRGDEIDVVALACTHFPLVRAELSAAAGRACVWLDCGEAVSRRLQAVLKAESGAVRPARAAFTCRPTRKVAAFQQRQFEHFYELTSGYDFAPIKYAHRA